MYFDGSNVPKCSSHLCCTGYNFASHLLLTSSLHIHTVTLKYACASAASYPNNVYDYPSCIRYCTGSQTIVACLFPPCLCSHLTQMHIHVYTCSRCGLNVYWMWASGQVFVKTGKALLVRLYLKHTPTWLSQKCFIVIHVVDCMSEDTTNWILYSWCCHQCHHSLVLYSYIWLSLKE